MRSWQVGDYVEFDIKRHHAGSLDHPSCKPNENQICRCYKGGKSEEWLKPRIDFLKIL